MKFILDWQLTSDTALCYTFFKVKIWRFVISSCCFLKQILRWSGSQWVAEETPVPPAFGKRCIGKKLLFTWQWRANFNQAESWDNLREQGQMQRINWISKGSFRRANACNGGDSKLPFYCPFLCSLCVVGNFFIAERDGMNLSDLS